MRVTSNYNLGKLYPDLIKEWYPPKNGDLTPYTVMPKSGKKVWWKCNQGHEWIARIADRSNGSGCPQCYNENRSVIIGHAKLKIKGSLAVKNQNLAREWHPTENKGLTPHDVTLNSHKKVWWRCSEGHEWEAAINNRTHGTGCPKCSKERRVETYRKAVLKRSGSLADKYPHLVNEWHSFKNEELTPYAVTSGSKMKVWWSCERGHEWKAQVYSRAKRGQGCPYCKPSTSRIEITLYCEMKTIFNDVKWREKIDGIECDIYLPKYKVGIELDGYLWHDGYEERDRNKGKQLLEKSVEVFRVRDKRLKQIASTDIFYQKNESRFSVIKRLLNKLMVHISFTNEDQLKILEYITLNQLQNSQESKRIISLLPSPQPEKSLAQLYPKLANEWNYEKNAPLHPRMFTPGSNRKVWWICKQGHEWETTIYERKRGTGCPTCYNEKRGAIFRRAVVKRRGSFLEKYPDLAKGWHPTKNGKLASYDVTPGSHKKVWWVCSRGHEWETTIKSRTSGTGCPYCAGKKASEDYNLAIKHPKLAKEWHPTKNNELTPSNITPKSHKKVWWKCTKGHEWKASVVHRVNGRGCPICYLERRSSK